MAERPEVLKNPDTGLDISDLDPVSPRVKMKLVWATLEPAK